MQICAARAQTNEGCLLYTSGESVVQLVQPLLFGDYLSAARVHCLASLADGVTLSAGTHTITISVDVKGVQFYGFRVCSAFSEEPTAGEAVFALAPRSFKDVNGNMAVPDKGFKLTLEMLRRKPDSALIWYEDFQDYGVLETDYWTCLLYTSLCHCPINGSL